jgi:hypothetical protein
MSETPTPGSGVALNDFAKRYRLNGDWIVCECCKAPQQVSWMLHDFPHRNKCKNATAEIRPWVTLLSLIGAQMERAKPVNMESTI